MRQSYRLPRFSLIVGLQEARARLPLPELMRVLGDEKHAKRSARCPFHDDARPSFSVFQNAAGIWLWKCHAGCGSGDGLHYLRLKFDLSTVEAIRHYCELAGVKGQPR